MRKRRSGCYAISPTIFQASNNLGVAIEAAEASTAARLWRKPLRVIGANLSMSGLGNCYDNAKAESFFSTLKSECLPATQVFDSKVVARRELFEYIETYHSNKHLHSALGYQSPRQFEVEHCKKGNNFFEENVSATPFQKRSEVQESKRNNCTGYPAVIHGCNGKHPKTCSVSL